MFWITRINLCGPRQDYDGFFFHIFLFRRQNKDLNICRIWLFRGLDTLQRFNIDTVIISSLSYIFEKIKLNFSLNEYSLFLWVNTIRIPVGLPKGISAVFDKNQLSKTLFQPHKYSIFPFFLFQKMTITSVCFWLILTSSNKLQDDFYCQLWYIFFFNIGYFIILLRSPIVDIWAEAGQSLPLPNWPGNDVASNLKKQHNTKAPYLKQAKDQEKTLSGWDQTISLFLVSDFITCIFWRLSSTALYWLSPAPFFDLNSTGHP